MAKSTQKITLSQSRDIPFNKLVLSQANVRRIKAGVSIEELAEDIARRTLLQSLTVRPVLDDSGAETGMFEIPAGGRRYRALELLIKLKRLGRTTPIPCVVRTEGLAEEDSLAENVQRAPLHPLDQFRAFQSLREKGRSEEEIAATFFVSVQVVDRFGTTRTRLRVPARLSASTARAACGSSAPTCGPKTSPLFLINPTRRMKKRRRLPTPPRPMKWPARSMVDRQSRTSLTRTTASSPFRTG
jgi:ParB/RepB/Spo0J family partition protein